MFVLSPRTAAAALVAAVLCCAPAQAQFSDPATIVDFDEGVASPVVAASGARTLIGWAHLSDKVLRYVVRDAAGASSTPVTLPGQGANAPDELRLAVDPDG